MGQPHKGDRVLLQTRPRRAVWDAIHEEAAQANTSVSQYVANVLAQHVGRPDLVYQTETDHQEGLPLAM